MLATLLELDTALFELINHSFHNTFLDLILPYWREKTTWIPLYLFIITFLIWKYRKQSILLIFMLIATVGFADTMSSKVIKKQVQRLRPCNNPNLKADVKLLVDCGSGYSFTSSHATNHFALAVFLVLLFEGIPILFSILLLLWAASIAFGQVYVGVHYPLDIVCGSLLGTCIAFLGFQVYNLIARQVST